MVVREPIGEAAEVRTTGARRRVRLGASIVEGEWIKSVEQVGWWWTTKKVEQHSAWDRGHDRGTE